MKSGNSKTVSERGDVPQATTISSANIQSAYINKSSYQTRRIEFVGRMQQQSLVALGAVGPVKIKIQRRAKRKRHAIAQLPIAA